MLGMNLNIWTSLLNTTNISLMSSMETIKEESFESDVSSSSQDLCSSPSSVIVIVGGFIGM
jgi:hypothetical protein